MKSLIDAQLPARLARELCAAGHDATHSSDLPEGNLTTDAQISELVSALEEAQYVELGRTALVVHDDQDRT